MARMGCTVRAFDPNVEGIPHYINPENIHFAKIGIDDVSSEFIHYEKNIPTEVQSEQGFLCFLFVFCLTSSQNHIVHSLCGYIIHTPAPLYAQF